MAVLFFFFFIYLLSLFLSRPVISGLLTMFLCCVTCTLFFFPFFGGSDGLCTVVPFRVFDFVILVYFSYDFFFR